jgi:hypothetical protein
MLGKVKIGGPSWGTGLVLPRTGTVGVNCRLLDGVCMITENEETYQ